MQKTLHSYLPKICICNYRLHSINYPNCTQIEGDVTISGNEITNLNGLNVLNFIGGYLNISDCNTLSSLTGLNNVTSIGEGFEIWNDDELTSLTGLNSLYHIEGRFIIDDNNALYSLTGLESLTFSDGLDLCQNPNLTNLNGLDNLTTIGGYLWICFNNNLSSLMGLEGLTSIGGYLELYQNNVLTSLTGLDNINAGSITGLHIYNNDSLSNCAIQSVCHYLASPTGDIHIFGNATGCHSQQEVEEDCATIGIEPLPLISLLSIYPNPTSNTITISTNTIGYLSILNLNGQELIIHQITEPKTQIDISSLPSGVYFVRGTNERTVKVGKFVKSQQ